MAEQPEFDSLLSKEIILYTTAARLALGYSHRPIECVGVFSSELKHPKPESDLSSPPCVRSRMVELSLHSTIRHHSFVINCLSTGTILPFISSKCLVMLKK